MQFPAYAAHTQFKLPHPGGEGEFRINVAEPANLPDDASQITVLVVTDGDGLYGPLAEFVRLFNSMFVMPPIYVVGVGYDPVDLAAFMKLRTADLTPPSTPEALDALGGLASQIGGQNGGADSFIEFLTGPLRSEIEALFPKCAGGKQILYGHSLGGLFAAHALATQPDSFDAFIVSSPSVWWSGFAILDRMDAFAAALVKLDTQPKAFISVGAREQDPPTKTPVGSPMSLEETAALVAASRMVDGARELADGFEKAGLKSLRHRAFDGEDHMTAIAPSMIHGLRFAMGLDD